MSGVQPSCVDYTCSYIVDRDYHVFYMENQAPETWTNIAKIPYVYVHHFLMCFHATLTAIHVQTYICSLMPWPIYLNNRWLSDIYIQLLLLDNVWSIVK